MSLHRAVWDGDLAKVQQLLAGGADANKPNGNGERPLHVAINQRHSAVALALIQAGADVNQTELNSRMKGTGRYTPLAMACVSGQVEIVEALLQSGARADFTHEELQREPRPLAPLAEAVAGPPAAAAKIVPMLLKAGADPNLFVDPTRTVLDIAEIWKSKRVLAILKKAGAKTASELRADCSPTAPVINNVAVAAKAGDLASVERLIRESADVNQADVHGNTPLVHAAVGGHEAVFQALLAAGARWDETFFSNWTLLTHAAYGGNLAIIRHLLAAGFAVDGKPNEADQTRVLFREVERLRGRRHDGRHPDWHTPLMAACWQGHLEAVKTLLEAGRTAKPSKGP